MRKFDLSIALILRAMPRAYAMAIAAMLVVLMANNAWAQWDIRPAPRKPSTQAPAKKITRLPNARPQAEEPLKLPFWDDFSFTPVDDTAATLSNYPLDSLWEPSYTVWVNHGIDINPPSINVATFDGLDSSHVAYNSATLPNGERDVMTSRFIDLSTAQVATNERDSVFLSFYFQWQGNGEAPDATDYMRVEFMNADSVWKEVMRVNTTASRQRDVFYDTLVKVSGDEYFHDKFRFRFTNYGRLSGPYDTWNIDYVYLNKHRYATELTSFPDRAITTPLSSLFDRYHVVPYNHFLTSKAVTAPTFDVVNLLLFYPQKDPSQDPEPGFTNITFRAEGTFYNYKGGVPDVYYMPNLAGYDTLSPINGTDAVIGPGERITSKLNFLPDPNSASQFNPASDSVLLKLKLKLFTGDTRRTNGYLSRDYDSLRFIPVDFRANDTLSTQYWLRDVYAYDDGIAEYAAGLTQAGNRAAVAFEQLPEQDTLTGIEFYAPPYGLPSPLTVDFYVYRDESNMPGEIQITLPSINVQSRGFNTLQRIELIEPILVAKRFYLGWRAPVGGLLRFGLDTGSDSGDRIFLNTRGTWEPADLQGSLMIRPIFGKFGGTVGIPEEASPIAVFPNPNNGDFFIRGECDQVEVITVMGQQTRFVLQPWGDDKRLTIVNAAAGIYLVKVRSGSTLTTHRVLVK